MLIVDLGGVDGLVHITDLSNLSSGSARGPIFPHPLRTKNNIKIIIILIIINIFLLHIELIFSHFVESTSKTDFTLHTDYSRIILKKYLLVILLSNFLKLTS